jgi:hypothetical protein
MGNDDSATSAIQLTGNQLKVIALVAMTLDHIGVILLPTWTVLRIVGRLAFPIFAYMVAEGCHYTHDRRRYLAGIALLGLACQVAYWLVAGSLAQSILTTLALGIVTVYGLEYAKGHGGPRGALALVGALALDLLFCVALPVWLAPWSFSVDYGFWGVMLPPLVYLPRLWCPAAASRRAWMLVTCSVGLVLLALLHHSSLGMVQWWSLLTLPLLALYRGRRGRWRMKHLFYVYYPLHLVVIWGVALLVGVA